MLNELSNKEESSLEDIIYLENAELLESTSGRGREFGSTHIFYGIPSNGDWKRTNGIY